MAYTKAIVFGGESGDSQTEVRDARTPSSVTVDTTAAYIRTGAGCDKFPLATNASRAAVDIGVKPQSPAINVLSGSVGASAQPNSGQMGLISNGIQGTSGTATGSDAGHMTDSGASWTVNAFVSSVVTMGGSTASVTANTSTQLTINAWSPLAPATGAYTITPPRLFRIGDTGGTDTKFRVYDLANNLLLTSNASCAVVGKTRFALSLDALNGQTVAGTVRVFIKLYLDGVEDTAVQTSLVDTSIFDTTKDFFWGEYLPAATNRGADMYGDDLAFRYSTTASDAPHITAYPSDISLVGGSTLPPTAESLYHEFSSTTASPNSYQDIDDYPWSGSDQLATTANSKRALFTYSAANPLSGSETIDDVQQGIVSDVSSGAKVTGTPLYSLAGTDLIESGFSTPSTSMVGDRVANMLRPGGGSWVKADFDPGVLSFGIESLVSGSIGWQVAAIPGPEIVYYTATLPKGAPPPHTLDAMWVPTNQPQFPQVRVVPF